MISIYSSLGQLNYLFVQMQLSKDYQTLTELKKKKYQQATLVRTITRWNKLHF